jgi:hypothetical protein
MSERRADHVEPLCAKCKTVVGQLLGVVLRKIRVDPFRGVDHKACVIWGSLFRFRFEDLLSQVE